MLFPLSGPAAEKPDPRLPSEKSAAAKVPAAEAEAEAAAAEAAARSLLVEWEYDVRRGRKPRRRR